MAHDHHSHHHGHHHHHDHGTGNLSFAFWLNTAFALLEIAGGLYTNSVAILSDALHDLGDSLSLGLAYYFHQKSHQKRDKHYSYGYRRFSLLGALINCMVLLVGSVIILQETIPRLFHPEAENPDAKGMLVFALIGILVNGAAWFRLKKGTSVNERVISLHFIEDILGWVAVLIGSVVMLFIHLPILDPIMSLLIAGYILFNVFQNLKSSFRIILQGIPVGISELQVRQKILSVVGVQAVHDLHLWTMDGEYNVLTAHAVVGDNLTFPEIETIKQSVKAQLQGLPIQHVTIEIENKNSHCALEEC
ncbi:MAG: cation diffusion facilitator family transporter [Bacteroidota bacterium]